MKKSSQYSGFYKNSVAERRDLISQFADLTAEEKNIIADPNSLTEEISNNMIENVIGRFSLPLAVATNFIINGKDYVIPMVTEEASVVAAASNAAKMARAKGGFHTSMSGTVMISQIQLTDLVNPHHASIIIAENKQKIIDICNAQDPVLIKHGGGALDVETRIVDSKLIGSMVVVHLKVNTLDAMGANAVNTMAEAVAPFLEELTKGKAALRILSNLAIYRLARARVTIAKEDIGGEEVVDKILSAYAFAEADPFRAVTHNKGIMNGITPVVMATGNDTRAIESGAHAYASISGRYTSLTTWEKDHNGDLTGTIEVPMAVGLVGGATKIHPVAKVAIKILGVTSSYELGGVIAAVGLAQNLAAIRALATDGIQKGHMSLHARNIASVAGAKGEILEKIVKQMVAEKKVRLEYAQELLQQYSK